MDRSQVGLNPAGLDLAQRKYGLRPDEMSKILLEKELGANIVLLDDYGARKLAKAERLEILGSVGLLETFYLRRYLTDLPSAFQQLLAHEVYIGQRLLDRGLRSLGLRVVRPAAPAAGLSWTKIARALGVRARTVYAAAPPRVKTVLSSNS